MDVHAVDELHHEVELALGRLAEIEDRKDGGVVEPGHGLGLLLEALGEVQFVRACGEGLREQLDGDAAVELGLPSLVDRTHAAPTDNAADLVLRQQGLQGFGRGRLPGGEAK